MAYYISRRVQFITTWFGLSLPADFDGKWLFPKVTLDTGVSPANTFETILGGKNLF